MRLVRPNIHYYGIDIAIHDPASNLIEADILKEPIRFADKRFNIVAALGVFEYVGASQDQKFSEIAELLSERGRFVLTYTNFGHRDKRIFEAFSNVQSFDDFRRSLARHFTIDRYFPTSYNWHGGQPIRPLLKAANMHVKSNIPAGGTEGWRSSTSSSALAGEELPGMTGGPWLATCAGSASRTPPSRGAGTTRVP